MDYNACAELYYKQLSDYTTQCYETLRIYTDWCTQQVSTYNAWCHDQLILYDFSFYEQLVDYNNSFYNHISDVSTCFYNQLAAYNAFCHEQFSAYMAWYKKQEQEASYWASVNEVGRLHREKIMKSITDRIAELNNIDNEAKRIQLKYIRKRMEREKEESRKEFSSLLKEIDDARLAYAKEIY